MISNVAATPERFSHIPWMGCLGYFATLIHLDAAMGISSRSCLVTLGQLVWPFSIVWALPALAILQFVPYEGAQFWYRIGLAPGFATWVFPILLLNSERWMR